MRMTPLLRQRRLLCSALIVAGTALLARPVTAQNTSAPYPSKPITLLVPAAPGGTSDITARLVGSKLGDVLGQPVVVTNKAGAGGNIGTAQAAQSAPNGYTLLIGNTTMVISPALYRNPGYDPVTDFDVVGVLGSVPNVLLVNPTFPAKTLAEFIQVVKAAPDNYSFASAGSGSPNHLLGTMLDQFGGLKLRHIPYKGAAPAMADVLGNQVPIVFASLPSALPYIQSGQLRALGVSSAKRSAALPDVPAIGEQLPGYAGELWVVVMSIKNTPAPIVDKLRSAFNQVLSDKETRQALDKLGMVPMATPAIEFSQYIAAEVQKWGASVKASSAQLD